MSVTRRQRKIPPTMFEDETLMELTTEQRQTGLGLYFYVDDHGRGSATPARVRADLWTLSTTMTDDQIVEHLEWLDQAGLIQLYEAEGRQYLAFLDWPSQDHPTASRIPPPPARSSSLSNTSRSPLEVLGVEEREEREKREGEGERGREGVQGEGPGPLTPDLTSPFCPRHQPSGTLGKCGPCGTARRAHDAWLKRQTDAAAADLEEDADRR